MAQDSYHKVDSGHDRPVVILALLLATTLGDFIDYNLFAASFKRQFRDARLIAYYRRDRIFKDAVVTMNPEIDVVWAQEGMENVKAEHFNVAPDDLGSRHVKNNRRVDILLTPSMMERSTLPAFDPPARFKIPTDELGQCDSTLADAGLDPGRWFCVLHYREPSYLGRGANPERDLQPEDAVAVTRYIVEVLGGQVVRLGHPEMELFPEMPGFVDLSRGPTHFSAQAHAVSRARYFVELSPSGPSALAPAFGVPILRCNAVQLWGPVDETGLVLMQHVIGPDGREVPLAQCVRKNLLNGNVMRFVLAKKGYRFRRNTLDELKAAVQEIHHVTEALAAADQPSWLAPADPEHGRYESCVHWPINTMMKHRILSYGHSTQPDPLADL